MKTPAIKFKILTVLITLTALFGCQGWTDRTVPKELVGVWVTAEQRYANCTLEVTDKLIIFNNISRDYTGINHITGIEKSIEAGQTIYNIDYKDNEGLEYTLSLVYSRELNKGVVQFKNEMGIKWTRKG